MPPGRVADPDRLSVRRAGITVEGIVQGVGFRPFVYRLANRLGLSGFVGNDSQGVFIEVEGDAPAVAEFLAALSNEAPPLADVRRVVTHDLPSRGTTGFAIVGSEARATERALVGPDIATCDECLRELLDRRDRRFRYPFVNCTHCGPRFTIVRDVPYDRERTTMAGFPMCSVCRREYDDPGDRRFHAQPVCCPACGPAVQLLGDARPRTGDDAVRRAVELLRAGAVVAVKGLGGWHLAADATSETAVAVLRGRKHREDKPFAILVRDLLSARDLCTVDDDEARLLMDRRRPIVLLGRRPDARVAASVAPGNRFLGLMLPYTPLHHLLAADLGRALVLTSGNKSDEPIAYEDDDALSRLRSIADAFLTHNRPIHIRTDDSVVRVVGRSPSFLRRSRGYVPAPLTLPLAARRPVLACGAQLKNTFCLARGRLAFVSHHIGDLENAETYAAFVQGIAHFQRLFDIAPAVVAHDLHPDYLSTKYATGLRGLDMIGVQHHHAHVASCLVDNGELGPVIGVAFDGLGYGTDGTLWGGEVLIADLFGFERVAHLRPVPMPGGTMAIRQPWRMAIAYLSAAGVAPDDLGVVRRHRDLWPAVAAVAQQPQFSPLTSSMGRLFDATAALVGVRDEISYEGQAAVELEQLVPGHADRGHAVRGHADRSYTVGIGRAHAAGPLIVEGADIIRAVTADLLAGTPDATIAACFHQTVADLVVALAGQIRTERGLDTVALSGGVFQNMIVLNSAVAQLGALGFRVLTHRRVPANDGGISLGQAAVAAARDGAPTGAANGGAC